MLTQNSKRQSTNPSAIYRSLSVPPGPKVRKNQKGHSAPGPPESLEKSQKCFGTSFKTLGDFSGSTCSNRAIWLWLRFMIAIGNRKSLAIWAVQTISDKPMRLFCCTGSWRCDSLTAIWTEVQITNCEVLDLRFEHPREQFGGHFCDLGSAIQIATELRFGAHPESQVVPRAAFFSDFLAVLNPERPRDSHSCRVTL